MRGLSTHVKIEMAPPNAEYLYFKHVIQSLIGWGKLSSNSLQLFDAEVTKANAKTGSRGHFVDFRPLKYRNYDNAVKGLTAKFLNYCNDNNAKAEALRLAKLVIAGRNADIRRFQRHGQHADAGHKHVKNMWDVVVRNLT